jgi:hypothetical protein
VAGARVGASARASPERNAKLSMPQKQFCTQQQRMWQKKDAGNMSRRSQRKGASTRISQATSCLQALSILSSPACSHWGAQGERTYRTGSTQHPVAGATGSSNSNGSHKGPLPLPPFSIIALSPHRMLPRPRTCDHQPASRLSHPLKLLPPCSLPHSAEQPQTRHTRQSIRPHPPNLPVARRRLPLPSPASSNACPPRHVQRPGLEERGSACTPCERRSCSRHTHSPAPNECVTSQCDDGRLPIIASPSSKPLD